MYTLLLHLASTSEFYTLSLHDALPICSVVSEYPPGTTPARHRFLVRNRLIAAFGAGTVVVEAGRRSGTLSTARSEEHTSELQSRRDLVCRLLLEKKKY